MNKRKIIISIIVLIIDQILKSIMEVIEVNKTIIPKFFSLSFYRNTGAAWSILEGRQTVLIIITIIVTILVYNLMFSFKENRLNDFAFGLLLGGIFGNLIDRIICGGVRDFISIYIFNYSFPVFNIADITIVLGVIMLIVSTVKGEAKNGSKSRRRKLKN